MAHSRARKLDVPIAQMLLGRMDASMSRVEDVARSFAEDLRQETSEDVSHPWAQAAATSETVAPKPNIAQHDENGTGVAVEQLSATCKVQGRRHCKERRVQPLQDRNDLLPIWSGSATLQRIKDGVIGDADVVEYAEPPAT
jgi:hypothetical protein